LQQEKAQCIISGAYVSAAFQRRGEKMGRQKFLERAVDLGFINNDARLRILDAQETRRAGGAKGLVGSIAIQLREMRNFHRDYTLWSMPFARGHSLKILTTQKRKIGETLADQPVFHRGAKVFLGAGAHTLHVFRSLIARHDREDGSLQDMVIHTNSVSIANEVLKSAADGLRVRIVVAGSVEARSGMILASKEAYEEAMEDGVDACVLGVQTVDQTAGPTVLFTRSADVKKLIIEKSKQVILVTSYVGLSADPRDEQLMRDGNVGQPLFDSVNDWNKFAIDRKNKFVTTEHPDIASLPEDSKPEGYSESDMQRYSCCVEALANSGKFGDRFITA
jgi:DeoR sensor domain-containing protein